MAQHHIPTADAVYIDIARQRFAGYAVSGSGHIAVVWHCRQHVELVGHALEARVLMAGRCGVVCRAGNGERRLHVAYDLNTPPQQTQRRSMARLPGWKEL